MTRLETVILFLMFIVLLAGVSVLLWIGGLSMRAETAATYQHHFMISTEE